MQEFAQCFEGVTGSEIRRIFTLLADPQIISLAGGNPSPEGFPTEEISQITQEILNNSSKSVLQYGNTAGIPQILELLKRENASVMQDYDDLIMLTGSSQGIDFFTSAFVNKGDAILVEAPTFLGALQTFKLRGAVAHTVDLLEDGVDIAMLEAKIKELKPKFFYVIPTFQNPTGITTSKEKREQIYKICLKYNVMILEDDPYASLRFEGEATDSIKSYDTQGIVCKLSSFSKTISPGLRVGYAIANKEIIHKFNLIKQGADVHTSNFTQAIVYEFLNKGYLTKHVEKLCDMYKKQRNEMEHAIFTHFPKDVKCTHPMGGLFIWVTLKEGTDVATIFSQCIENKVAFVPGTPFYAQNPKTNTLRLNFSMPTLENINIGIERIGKILNIQESI